MNRILIISVWLLFFVYTNAISQANKKSKCIESHLFGTNLLTKLPIKGKLIEYPLFIQMVNVDSSYDKLILKFSKKEKVSLISNPGQIAFCDRKNGSISWAEKLTYTKSIISKKYLIYFDEGKTTCIDRETEKILWKSDARVSIVRGDYGYSGSFSAVNLKNGVSLWKRSISNTNGFDDMVFLGDTALVVASSGLHLIKNIDGNGWDYTMKSMVDNTVKTAAVTAAGILLSPLTGFYFVPLSANSIYGISSDILMDSSLLFYAARNKIVCLDLLGKVKWVKDLPDNYTSESKLLNIGNNVVLVNLGYAKQNHSNVIHGKAFVSSFRKSDGTLNYMRMLDDKSYVKSYILKNNSLTALLNNNTINVFDLIHGDEKLNVKVNKSIAGTLSQILDSKKYYRQIGGGKFVSYSQFDSSLYVFSNTNNEAIVLDKNFDVEDKISVSQAYILQAKTEKYRYIFNQGTMNVINNENKNIAKFNSTKDFFVYNEKCYFIKEKSLGIIDVSEFDGK